MVDMVKSYLESIGFDLLSLIQIIGEQVNVQKQIILTGGLARSDMICRLLADILGKEIITLKSLEGSLMGAAIFGHRALGILPGLSYQREKELREIYVPRMEVYMEYQKKYVRYVKLRNILREFET